MELLEIKAIALAEFVSQIEDDLFADLVGDCLAWPPQVASCLRPRHFVWLERNVTNHLHRKIPRPGRTRMEVSVVGDRKLAMRSDVDHHTTCPVELCGQHSELILGFIVEPEFAHQMLGIQCPAFARTRGPDSDAVKAREFVTHGDLDADL